MLIIYEKSSGNILNNQGIVQGFPLGMADTSMLIDSLVEQLGGTEEDYGVFRLHDEENKEIVEKTFTHDYTIQNGEIVFGAEEIIPEPEPQPPTEIELLKQENLALQLALAETIEKQETDKINNQIALAELVEKLTLQGVL